VRKSWAFVAVLALLAGPAVAEAKPPLGSPRVVRASTPADHVGRADARTEWWRLRGVNRRTGAWFELYLLRDGGLWGSSLVVVDKAGQERRGDLGFTAVRAGRDRLIGRGAGSLTIRRIGGGFRVTLDDPEATATLRLRSARRGPAALGWRMKPRPAGGTRVDGMSWAVPVATSVLSGRFAIRDTPTRVDGWRASYEHGWGSIDLSCASWVGWDQYIVHGRHGTAWILHGLNRRDTVESTGRKDRPWMGVLARVDAGGVRACRARIARSDWWMTAQLVIWARRARARCGGMRLAVRDGLGVYDEWDSHDEIRVAARGRGRLVGAGVHLTSGGF
jgi:hypothetical protein